jgi:hypothetical protein
MKEKQMKKRIFGALMSFLFVFLPVIQLVAGGSLAFAETGTWNDITGTGDLSYPNGIAVDSSGNVYVANGYGDRIKKLSNGSWTDITGWGKFARPTGIAVDSSGNVYVADSVNGKIKKLLNGTRDGVWDDITGSGGFNNPTGIAVDSSGNVYVADTDNGKVKKLSNGRWTDIGSTFFRPTGVAVDSGGNVYVVDKYEWKIKKLSNGSWTDITGAGVFNAPFGIAVNNSGNVYVTDTGNKKIKKLWNGSWLDITGSEEFSTPEGVAADSSGNVYVTDSLKSNLKKITDVKPAVDSVNVSPSSASVMLGCREQLTATVHGAVGGAVTTVTWSSSDTNNKFAVDSTGKVTVAADAATGDYTKITATSTIDSSKTGTATITATAAVGANTVTYDGNGSTEGTVPTDSHTYKQCASVRVPGNTGSLVKTSYTFAGWNTAADGSGTSYAAGAEFNMGVANATLFAQWTAKDPWTDITGSGGFNVPSGVAVDSSGNVYVADYNNKKINKLSNGSWMDITGSGGFASPLGVAVDSSGNVYVADIWSSQIKKLSNGSWTDITGSGDFSMPAGVAVDSSGNVYVVDTFHSKIKKLSNGSWTDITGLGDFNLPGGVAVDSSGNVYVTDTNHSKIKKLSNGSWMDITGSGGLSGPTGIAVDSSGNVYVADYYNAKIKKLSNGSWTDIGLDITGSGGFSAPIGMAVDSSGNVYVTDFKTNKIKKLTEVKPSVDRVSISPSSASVVQGGRNQLTATVDAVGGAVTTVMWSSSDTNNKVAVDSTGKVTVAADAATGDYKITATSTANKSKKGTATITVTAAVSADTVTKDILKAALDPSEVPGQSPQTPFSTPESKVYFFVPYGSDITHLTPILTVSPNTVVKSPIGPQDFSKGPVTYTIQSTIDQSVKDWSLIIMEEPILQFSSEGFYESYDNDGTITTVVTATLYNDTFYGDMGVDYTASGKVIVTQLPPGLTAIATKISDTTVAIQLNGAATAHEAADSIANLHVKFQEVGVDHVLSNFWSPSLTNREYDLTVQFNDATH